MHFPKLYAIALAAMLASGPAAALDRMVDGFPELPPDARAVAERSLGCQHFGGELLGDGGARDREVNTRMKRLRCDRVERDLKAVRAKYRRDRRVLKVLREAEPPPD